jgi:hypothetical protein
METTKRYRLPYPSDGDQVRALPDIIRQQAEGIDEALAGFDYDGTDPNKLTARMAAVERQLDAIRGNTVVLYDNDSTPFSGAITLSESAANFERLTICFRSNDNVFSSMDVVNPDGKAISLTTSFFNEPSHFFLKNRCYKITGKTINTYSLTTDKWVTGETNVCNSNQGTGKDVLVITQVIGVRKNSII